MPRKPQFGSIYRRGSLYWIKYYKNGEPVYESSESCKYGDWVERVLRKHLRPYFGSLRAATLKYENAQRYIEQRQACGAANATVNRELSLLHRAFSLGKEAGRVNAVPMLPKKLKENNV